MVVLGVSFCFFSSRRRHTRCALVTGVQTCALPILTLFGLIALSKLGSGAAFDPTPIRLSWFNPFEIDSFSALAAGLSLSIFIFWGWDVTLTMNEETKGSRSTPGRAATLTVVTTVMLYLLATTGSIGFAGLGTGEFGLGNPDVQRNAFLALAAPVLEIGRAHV